MPSPQHLVTVWNPSYADDAMDAHLRVLLHWAEHARARDGGGEEAYVWWAKVRSPNRQQPLPHPRTFWRYMTRLMAVEMRLKLAGVGSDSQFVGLPRRSGE